MHKLFVMAVTLAVLLPAAGARAQGDAFNAIVAQCAADVKAGTIYGNVGDDPFQACVIEKGIHKLNEGNKPAAVRMGTVKRGLEAPKIFYGGAANNAGEQTAITAPDKAGDSFAGGVAGDNLSAQAQAEQAPAKPPSAVRRYYLQSGKSGSGAKPIFLNR